MSHRRFSSAPQHPPHERPFLLWRAFLRLLIVFLLVMLAGALYLWRNPAALRGLVFSLPYVSEMPEFGPRPPAPHIASPPGPLPAGDLSFSGYFQGVIDISCGFLLELEDGRRVGVSTAHSLLASPNHQPAEFRSADGAVQARLLGLEKGRPFSNKHLSADYILWSLAETSPGGVLLRPDPRGQAQPGEDVLVYGRNRDASGGSQSWPAVVMLATPDATWLQLEDSFNPMGLSGCPVVSRHTGRVIGMVVAGRDLNPVVMGLHPIASLVEKAAAALPAP